MGGRGSSRPQGPGRWTGGRRGQGPRTVVFQLRREAAWLEERALAPSLAHLQGPLWAQASLHWARPAKPLHPWRGALRHGGVNCVRCHRPRPLSRGPCCRCSELWAPEDKAGERELTVASSFWARAEATALTGRVTETALAVGTQGQGAGEATSALTLMQRRDPSRVSELTPEASSSLQQHPHTCSDPVSASMLLVGLAGVPGRWP